MSTVKFDTWESSDGTEEYFKCRAWVRFDALTGTMAITGAGNVSSVTDNGTGDYTVNFTNEMPDANYSFTIGSSDATVNTILGTVYVQGSDDITTSSLTLYASTSDATSIDREVVCVHVFR